MNEGERIAESLVRFVAAYRRGLAVMGAQSPAWKSTVFDDRLREQLELRCDLLELLRVRSFLEARRRGLVAARRGELDASRLEFQRAEAALEQVRGAEPRRLCESLYCAALAYLCYRCEEPERSKQLVGRALALDSELETEFGGGALYGHRFQLVQNLVRVEARFGETERATRLALELLEQLEGRPGAAPTPHAWSESDPERLPPELRRTLANQIAFELATIHLGSATRRAESRRYAEHIHACRARDEIAAVEAHAWLGLAASMESSSLAEAVDLSTGVLARGPGQSPPLWYSVVLLCLERLSRDGAPAARSTASAILLERAHWPHVPSALRGPIPSSGRRSEAEAVG